LFSSYVSHIVSTRVRLPALLRTLTSTSIRADAIAASKAHGIIAPSLGASGAIYAAVTASALAYPDANVSLIFLPFVSLPIGAGVGGMVCLDIIGIIRGWRCVLEFAHSEISIYPFLGLSTIGPISQVPPLVLYTIDMAQTFGTGLDIVRQDYTLLPFSNQLQVNYNACSQQPLS
jgi:hypothetical protein